MIEPYAKDEEFLADVREHRGLGSGPRIWWLGQSGFLIHWEGHFLLMDPYLSDSLTQKYATTSTPHVRMTERVVNPSRLGMAEVVTSSHNHTDHLDPETLGALWGANPTLKLVIPEANREFAAARLRCDLDWPVGLNDGETVQAGPFKLHGVASAHEQLDQDERGLYPYLGYVVEAGPWTVYHPGDTVLYPGLAEKLRRYRIDVALLPVNGRLAERRVAGNLWGREAAWLAKEIRAGLAIPCHFEMFEFNTVSPDEFVENCKRLGQRYFVLRNGEGVTV